MKPRQNGLLCIIYETRVACAASHVPGLAIKIMTLRGFYMQHYLPFSKFNRNNSYTSTLRQKLFTINKTLSVVKTAIFT